MFTPAADASGLLVAQPAWLLARQFTAWSAGPSLVGWVLWGHAGDDDAEAMKQLWIALAARMQPPYDFVLDLRSLHSISAGAYARIHHFTATRKPGLRRMAVLVSEHTHGGAIQLGLYVLRPPQFEWRSFRTYDEAAAWFARPESAAILAAVDERTRDRAAQTAPLARLRALLAGDPSLPLERAAHAMGVSSRSLQRALGNLGTTVSAERDRARVLQAIELLRDPSAKLDAVATSIGCADRRSLNRLFRRITGESPAEFRQRHASRTNANPV